MLVTREYEFIIQWHLTERCNLRCRHCYQEGRPSAEMALPEIKEVIAEIAGMFNAWRETYGLELAPSFSLTGGEPFLRSDFFNIVEDIAGRGFAVFVLSNGTVIDRDRARKLAALGVKGVQVSMEGPREVHDQIRGSGSFAAAVAGIRELLQAGVRVSLNTTLSTVNADHFLELVDLAVLLKVPELGFFRLVPSGRGKLMLEKMLTTTQVRDFYQRLLSMKVPGLTIGTGDPMAAQMAAGDPEDAGAIPLGGCAAGVSGLTLLPDGTVLPCRRLPIPLGNVRRESLREIWAASPVLEALRDRSRYRGKCGACRLWAQCRGCRAIAYAYSQGLGTPDFLTPDPQCFIDGN
jgi:radical SAM protein with 4Fe4S-binding SPASM domain